MLQKDILNLVYLSKFFGLPEVADFWEGVVKLNDWNQHRLSTLIVKKLFGTVSGKKIGILGFSFKANTNDTRESAAISICKDLLGEGAFLSIHDPKVDPKQITLDLGLEPIKKSQNSKTNLDFTSNEGRWQFSDNISDTLFGADAAVVLTEWDKYAKIDWESISQSMRNPSLGF